MVAAETRTPVFALVALPELGCARVTGVLFQRPGFPDRLEYRYDGRHLVATGEEIKETWT